MDQNLASVWKTALSDIKKQVTQGQFFALFKNTSLLSIENNQALIAAPSTMVVDLLQKRFGQMIQSALEKHVGNPVTLQFTTKTPIKEQAAVDNAPLFAQTHQRGKSPVGHLPRVRPDYLFQNFAVSGSNQLAFVSANTVAMHIGTSYNPFFIYGPVGVGKTHLMHAIANDVYHKDPSKKIIYITSEEFTNEIVDAIRTQQTAAMKKRFRSAFLLLIDDIQFIEGKEKVQEELFHTFNTLIDNGSQICFTSDRPPHEIKRIDDRLSSRFASGLSVDIEPPDIELKTAILQLKASKFGHTLPTDVAMFLAENAEDNRKLEGLLLRLITQATATGEELSLTLAKKSLGQMVEEHRGHLHAEDIINSVCNFYRIKATQLKGPKREASLVKARQVAMYLLKNELDLTYMEIGNLLGGRDHTTIIHGVDKIGDMVHNKAAVSEDIMGITKTLRG